MDARYYYSEGTKKSGPLEAGELRKLNLSPDTLVWRQGMDSWMKIGEVDEIKNEDTVKPPPLPSDLVSSKIRYVWLINIGLIIASVLVWIVVDSIVITMPLTALIGLLAVYRFKKLERFYKIIFYSPIVMIIVGLAIIIFGQLDERYDAEVFAVIINLPAGCIILLSIEKLWASVKS